MLSPNPQVTPLPAVSISACNECKEYLDPKTSWDLSVADAGLAERVYSLGIAHLHMLDNTIASCAIPLLRASVTTLLLSDLSFTAQSRVLLCISLSVPDISIIVNKLCQYNHNPSEVHAKAAKHLLCYIARTLDYGITYSHHEGSTLCGMFMDHDNSLSTTPLYDNRADVSLPWRGSRKDCDCIDRVR